MKKAISTLLVTCIMIIKLKHSHILLPKKVHMQSYEGQTKWMYFLIEDDDLLAKYITAVFRIKLAPI